MTRSVPVGAVRLLGDRAFLIGVEDAGAARAVAGLLGAALGSRETHPDSLDRRGHPDSVEVVCGEATVMVAQVGPGAGPVSVLERESVTAMVRDAATAALGTRTVPAGGGREERVVTIPCHFDGPDLNEVCAHAGLSEEELVGAVTGRLLSVGVVGFSPGFAYLDGLPPELAAVPRRPEPRPVVPRGSVALANGRAAVYPTASPGGWHLIGRTGFPLFTPDRPPYAHLAPGDRVRFRVAGAADPREPLLAPEPVWAPPDGARAVLEVVAPGLRSVVQDGGRHGVASAGIPGAGPADPVSFHVANRLVNNPSIAGSLELTLGGASFRALNACYVAVVGAVPEVTVDGVGAPAARVLPLARGQLLRIGPVRNGCRTYVAVAGGILGPTVFGSTASDELTRLGAGPLRAGQRLFAGEWAAPLGDRLAPGAATELVDGEPVGLRVVAGPHAELFAPDALDRATRTTFVVEPDSNRVGVRLRPEHDPGTLHADGAPVGALDSHGVVTGTVQVPPDGRPVILSSDHATLGGYPVLAVVAQADLGRLGQCAPGTRVRLLQVEPGVALEAASASARALEVAVLGRYPLAVG